MYFRNIFIFLKILICHKNGHRIASIVENNFFIRLFPLRWDVDFRGKIALYPFHAKMNGCLYARFIIPLHKDITERFYYHDKSSRIPNSLGRKFGNIYVATGIRSWTCAPKRAQVQSRRNGFTKTFYRAGRFLRFTEESSGPVPYGNIGLPVSSFE